MAVGGDVLIEFDMHEAIFLKCMHLSGFGLPRLQETQGLRNRHLVDKRLVGLQRFFRNAVPGLDDGCIRSMGGGAHFGCLFKELPD